MKYQILLSILLISSPFTKASVLGYGSSTSTLTAKNQENIFMGFELGFKELVGEKKASEILIVKQNMNDSQLGALESLKFLMEKAVIGIAGFSGSHDSVLVGKNMKDKNILTIFPGSNHNSINEFGSSVFTTGHSMNEEVVNTLTFIEKFFVKKSGFAIINKYAVASSSIDILLNNPRLNKMLVSSKLEKLYLDKNLLLSKEDLIKVKNNSNGFLYYTAYPEAMVGVAKQLEENQVDLPVVAASSWGLGDSDLLRRFNTKKKQPLYISSEWNKNSIESKHFTKYFKKIYGREPSPENALGYDVGIIFATTYKRVIGQFSKESFLRAFHQNLCFKNLSVGTICFNKEGGHSNVKPRFYLFNSTGDKLVF